MLEIKDVSYRYHKSPALAVNDARGSVAPGIWLLLGHNGAGKTTLLRVIATLLKPMKGECLLDGEMMQQRSPGLLQRIFFMSDDMWVPARTVNELARIDGRFYPNFSEDVLRDNLLSFGLTGDEVLADMSLGQRRKGLIAYSLALGVELLMMDEPANGLDIGSKKTMRAMMARCIDETQTVIISTHNVADLRELYDGLMVMQQGHLVLCAPTYDISERVTCVRTQLPVPGALYSEQSAGVYNSVISNTTGEPGAIDFGLLYSAIMSDKGQAVLWAIHQSNDKTEK